MSESAMARPKSPDSRRVPISFKLTDAEAELVDSLRGKTERSVWLRESAMTVANAKRNSRIPESLGIEITVDDRQPPGIVSVIAPGEAKTEVRAFALTPEEAAPKTANCKHKGLRMAKGVCPECQTYVARKR